MKNISAIRIIIVNHLKQILLMKIHSDFLIQNFDFPQIYWIMPGGKIHSGESSHETLIRELKEETGISKDQITNIYEPAVWQSNLTFKNKENNLFFQLSETFFLINVNTQKISTDGFTDNEKKYIYDLRWWPLEKIKKSKEYFLPLNLYNLLKSLDTTKKTLKILT